MAAGRIMVAVQGAATSAATRDERHLELEVAGVKRGPDLESGPGRKTWSGTPGSNRRLSPWQADGQCELGRGPNTPSVRVAYRCELPSRVLPLYVFFTWDAN